MKAPHQTSVADLYTIDLERYLFAPAPRRKSARRHRVAAPVREWLREWFGGGLMRCKELAQVYLL